MDFGCILNDRTMRLNRIWLRPHWRCRSKAHAMLRRRGADEAGAAFIKISLDGTAEVSAHAAERI
jgi:hypothetical protein